MAINVSVQQDSLGQTVISILMIAHPDHANMELVKIWLTIINAIVQMDILERIVTSI